MHLKAQGLKITERTPESLNIPPTGKGCVKTAKIMLDLQKVRCDKNEKKSVFTSYLLPKNVFELKYVCCNNSVTSDEVTVKWTRHIYLLFLFYFILLYSYYPFCIVLAITPLKK